MRNVLLDTGVWSDVLRRRDRQPSPVAQEAARLIRLDAVRLIGPIRQEILAGAQPSERFDSLKKYLRYYPNILLDETDDETAADYYNRCRGKGIQGSAVDFLICSVSVRHRLKIFTVDRDFDQYSQVLPIRLHTIGSALR